MTRVLHAAAFVKMTHGQWKQLATLCGLNALAESVEVSPDAESVTCKTCRRSRGWDALLFNLKAYDAEQAAS